MKAKEAKRIAPVLVLSTGRCGSTMVSEVLNTHPDVLSLSEFFISLGMKSLIRKRLNGKALWGICRRHSSGLRAMLAGDRDRILYPFDTPQARYSTHNIPSILCVVLPHLTPDYEALYDEIEPIVRARPKATLFDQYLFLFDWLCKRLGRTVGRLAAVRPATHGAFSAGTGGPYPPRRTGYGAIDEQSPRVPCRCTMKTCCRTHAKSCGN